MALLKSESVPLGTRMPGFVLKDPEGDEFSSVNLVGKKGLLVIFTCNHCPYAQAVWERFIKIASQAKKLGINSVAINPNLHPDYPDDSPEKMKELIRILEIKFPYLIDSTQDVAKSFNAQCTPDIYLFNNKEELVYHGRIDDNWHDEALVTKHELLSAVNALANDLDLPKAEDQKPSMGCSIKWKS